MIEEQKIHKIFKGYLTTSNIKEDDAQKIIKLAESYDSNNKQKQFLGRFQHVLKKCYDQKNHKLFVTTCKRFLFIIHKLLQKDAKKEKAKKYTEIISEQIVQYYLFFFSIIFKHSLHDLFVDLKMYRMKWVKRITDNSFIRLRQEILRKYKFNLDKGFSQENLQKIKALHKKRGLTQKQSNRYLGLQNVQENLKETKGNSQQSQSDSQSSNSEQSYQNNQKRIKLNPYNQAYEIRPPIQYSYPNYNPNMNYPPPPQSNYYEANKMQMTQTFDPRIKRQQIPQNYQYNQGITNNPVNYFPYPVQNLPREQNRQPLKNFNQPNINRPAQFSNYEPYAEQKNYPQKIIQSNYYQQKPQMYDYSAIQKKNDSLIIKLASIRQKLQKNSIKCRQCGQLFQTHNIYQKHTTQHFFDSLSKVNQNDNKGKVKKQSKIKLFDLKSWQADVKENEKEQNFQILFSELAKLNLNDKNDKKECLFCNQEFEIVFSSTCDQWVLSDAVKIQFQGKINIMHFQCYECFKSDENSPVEQIKI